MWFGSPKQNRAEEIHDCHMWVRSLEIAGMVGIESPLVAGARNLRTALDMAMLCGGVCAALVETGADIRMVAVASWKKAVVGRGNADKDEVARYVREQDPDFAGREGISQDAADAWCISRWRSGVA